MLVFLLLIGLPVSDAAVKVIVPLCAVVLLFLIARVRRFSLPELLALRSAPVRLLLLWLALAAAWMLTSNALIDWRGPWDFAPWRAAPFLTSLSRVLAIGILGPIAEELIFRGALYGRLAPRCGPVVAIILLAVIWASIHFSYTFPVIAVIFVEGLLLSAARWQTASILPPILMHILWNLYAVW